MTRTPPARFKDLVVDAVDPARLGAFWASTLGLEAEPLAGGEVHLVGPTALHGVRVVRVAEPVTVKQRVHLDVHAASTDDVLALGATLERRLERWDVLRDPEGGELCVFVRDEVPAYRLYEVCVDAVDHRANAEWWAEVLGCEVGHGEDGFSWLTGDALPFEEWVFETVPEPKTVGNRIHWDVVCPDERLLVERGATVLRPRDGRHDGTVMADPEGNEFCSFLPAG